MRCTFAARLARWTMLSLTLRRCWPKRAAAAPNGKGSHMNHYRMDLNAFWVWWTDPVARQEIALHRAERQGLARMMDSLRRALRDADELGIQFHGNRLVKYKQVLDTVAPVLSGSFATTPSEPPRGLPSPTSLSGAPQAAPAYVISSATLAQAHAYLTQPGPDSGMVIEWMLAVTGIKQDNLRTLEHLIEVQLSTQSAGGAGFSMSDFTRIAITLHEQGMALHAILHSHPTAGPPQPSAVDWRLQDRLEQGGYPAIQAVFSQDGYIRFFARRPFALTVSGKGVECVDQSALLYKLVHFGTLPQPRHGLTPKR